jgi:ubiquinone/menaquinone biosynthesis C-methylase UbiE
MTYTAEYFTTRETWRDWRIEAYSLMSLAHAVSGSRVLETGCGSGGLLRLLAARGVHPVGVDASRMALELAQQRAPGAAVAQVGEGAALPFGDGCFDAVVGQHVVEHLPDPAAALREWRRVLKPGGRLALATPNARYPDPAHFADDDHDHVFTPGELRSAAEAAGFSVVACYTVFPYLTRLRPLRALGVAGHQLFRRLPYFAGRGRTILLGATRM